MGAGAEAGSKLELRGLRIICAIMFCYFVTTAGPKSPSPSPVEPAAAGVGFVMTPDAAWHCRQQQAQWQQQWLTKGGCTGDPNQKYDIKHLTQDLHQNVGGPVQDDEALLLFAVVRGMVAKTVVEIGGLGGYSAFNFLRAMDPMDGMMFTVDIKRVPIKHPTRHVFIHKNVFNVTADDLQNRHIDLIFFDCHVVDAQMHLYDTLVKSGMLDEDSIIALHDTNLHPMYAGKWAYPLPDRSGKVHQPAERIMVEELRKLGWDSFSLHPPMSVHKLDGLLPFRHGVTLMQKFRHMPV